MMQKRHTTLLIFFKVLPVTDILSRYCNGENIVRRQEKKTLLLAGDKDKSPTSEYLQDFFLNKNTLF